MSLIVENGTGKSNADAYVTLAECDAYHVRFGNSGWKITTGAVSNEADRKSVV